MVDLRGVAEATRRRVITEDLAERIAKYLPPRIQLHQSWMLKYSLEQNGASLRTLYERAHARPGDPSLHGWVLALETMQGNVLGAYINVPLKPAEGAHYSGNGDCFVWRVAPTGLEQFGYTGSNDFVLFCTHHFLSLGGGNGHYALWVDDNLDTGVSYPTPTFANPVLAEAEKFRVLALELWQI